MSFTFSDIIDAVRPLCNDVDASTWSDDNFLEFLNEGVLLLYSEHPECRLTTAGVLTAFMDSDASNTVPLDDNYRIPLIEYMVYRFFDSDAGDTRDKSRAAEHLARFNELVGPSK